MTNSIPIHVCSLLQQNPFQSMCVHAALAIAEKLPSVRDDSGGGATG